MNIDSKTIENLAQLARIEVSDSEKESLTNDLGGVLAYVDQISEIAKNLDDVEPAHQLLNISADDNALNTGNQFSENILNEAPMREGEYLVVKKVL